MKSGNKMKLPLLILGLPLMAVMSSAMADPTAGPSGELTVTGNYVPGACYATLANNGTIDYGRIQSSSLSSTKYTTLSTMTLANAVTITCPTATSVAFSLNDNRATSAINAVYLDWQSDSARKLPSGIPSIQMLGLGTDSDSHKIGNYLAEMNNAKVGGVPQFFSGNGAPFSTAKHGSLPAYRYIPVEEATGYVGQFVNADQMLLTGSIFTMDYSVNAQIAPTNTLSIDKEITLDGSMTVNLYYL